MELYAEVYSGCRAVQTVKCCGCDVKNLSQVEEKLPRLIVNIENRSASGTAVTHVAYRMKKPLTMSAQKRKLRGLQLLRRGTRIADRFIQKAGDASMKPKVRTMMGTVSLLAAISCSTPMTTRETGAVVGGVGGAAAGGIVGSAVGHPGAGAAVGGALGLGAGALIGDRIQALEQKQTDLDKQIQENDRELHRQRQELERLKKGTKEQ